MFDFKVLNDLAVNVYKANKAKGFWDEERNVGELLMLIVSELGEALEAHRKGKKCNLNRFEKEYVFDLTHADFEHNVKDTFEDEIADTLIRIFDLAGGLNIDLAYHVEAKLNYNKKRPHKHGKNY